MHFDWTSSSRHCSCAAQLFHFRLIRIQSKTRNPFFRDSTRDSNPWPLRSAAVFYQLSYEDLYVGSSPIYQVHLFPFPLLRANRKQASTLVLFRLTKALFVIHRQEPTGQARIMHLSLETPTPLPPPTPGRPGAYVGICKCLDD